MTLMVRLRCAFIFSFVFLITYLIPTHVAGHSFLNSQAQDHSCGHGNPVLKQSIFQQPLFPESKNGDVRNMAEQAESFQPIRIQLNTTFIDSPSTDRSRLTNGLKVCTEVGTKLIISTETGDGRSVSTACLDDQGRVVFVGNCYIFCKAEDIVSPELVTKLSSSMKNLEDYFEKWLKVERFPYLPTINTDGECGDLQLTNQSLEQDIVIYITMRTMPYLPTTLAFANPCALHPISSRPVMMHVNVQPRTLMNNTDIETVLKHEVLHGLGFSSDLYKFYRHPSSRSKTYYSYDPEKYPKGPVISNNPRAIEMNYSNDVFGPQIVSNQLGPGNWLKLVTPNLIDFAKKYFDCTTIDGVELENDGNNASVATHWESRILYWELMTPVQKSIRGALTGFTLALLKDMGFYDVADDFFGDEMDFGFKKGCSFVQDRCDTKLNGVRSWYFCNNTFSDFCGYNNKFIGRCNVREFDSDLPKPYQYFSKLNEGGSDEFINRCPMAEAYTNGFCESRPSLNQNNSFLETNGPGSRCYRSSVLASGYVIDGDSSVVRCFKTVCVDDKTSMVRLGEYFFKCSVGKSVEFIGPASEKIKSNYETFVRTTVAQGVFECFDPSNTCHPQIRSLNADVKMSQGWPSITSYFPQNLTIDGGDRFFIFGTSLSSCIGARVGEADTLKFTVHNSSCVSFEGPVMNQLTGGGDPDGSGEVQLQLKCKVEDCKEGCFVAYSSLFLYPRPPEEEKKAPPDSLEDFFSSTAGQIVLAIVGILVVAGLVLLIKAMFCTSVGNSFEVEEEEEAEYTLSKTPKGTQKPLMAQEMHDL